MLMEVVVKVVEVLISNDLAPLIYTVAGASFLIAPFATNKKDVGRFNVLRKCL